MSCFKAWAWSISNNGFAGFYESGMFADYPPGYMYVLYVVGNVCQAFGITYESSAYKLMIEMPAILADLAIALLAYFYAKKHLGKERGALTAFVLLFIPCLPLTSAVL